MKFKAFTDLAVFIKMPLRAEKVPGTFEKRAPGPKSLHYSASVFLVLYNFLYHAIYIGLHEAKIQCMI